MKEREVAYRRGAVMIRISEKDMEKAMREIAERSVSGAADFLAGLAQKFIKQRNLINKGDLLRSIKVRKGGRGSRIGVYYQVYADSQIAPHAAMQHAGSGPITPKTGMFLYLKGRRNDYGKRKGGTTLVWRTRGTVGYQPQPFLEVPAKALRERDFAYAVQRNPVTSGGKKPMTPRQNEQKLIEALKKSGMYGKGSGSGTGARGSK